MRRCLFRRQKNVKSIANYISEMKELDAMLATMCLRIEADIKKITHEGKITKATIRRRLLLKKHYTNVDNRRTQVLARVLQLENLHLNSLQVKSLKSVSAAHSHINVNVDDVEELLDKLNTFTEDFEEISNRLNTDLEFNMDVSEEELERELYQEIESTADSKSVSINLPVVHVDVPKSTPTGRDLQGSMVDEVTRKTTAAVNA